VTWARHPGRIPAVQPRAPYGGPRRSTERRPSGMRLVPANDHVLLAGRQEHGVHRDHEWGRSGADDMVSGGHQRVRNCLPLNQESLEDSVFRGLFPSATLLWSWVSGFESPRSPPSKAAPTSGFIPRVPGSRTPGGSEWGKRCYRPPVGGPLGCGNGHGRVRQICAGRGGRPDATRALSSKPDAHRAAPAMLAIGE